MTPRPAANLLAVTLSALLAAALVAPALRPVGSPGSRPGTPAVASLSGLGSDERDNGFLQAGAPETGGPRNKGRDPSSTPPLVLPPAASPALQGTGLPDSGGRGPVSRDPRRAAAVAPRRVSFAPEPSAAPKRVLAATARSQTASHALRGTATFYCAPPRWPRCTVGYPAGSVVAAAGPALRQALGSGWRGRYVTVCYPDCRMPRTSVRLQVVDCNCGPGANLIDVYGVVMAQLAPDGLSRGVLPVEVEL